MSQKEDGERHSIVKTKTDIFRTRYVPLSPRLFLLARAIIGDDDEAADAVQETMVKIWNRINDAAEITNPEGFAIRVVKTTAIDLLRKHPKQTTELPEETVPPDADYESTDFLVKAINLQPPGQREVLRLSFLDDLPPDEIAEVTGLTPANVRQILSRGRRKIREYYTKQMDS